MPMFDEVFRTLGLIAVGGGGLVGIAYWVFRQFTQKWLDAKFQERLEAFKHDQNKEIERLRFQINALLDRATKLSQREFEVLPEAWARLHDAFWEASLVVSSFQSFPDVNKFSDEQLEEFISSCDLSKWEKTELRAAQDKTNYYSEKIYWHRLHDAKATARKCNSYLAKNGIFLTVDIKSSLDEISSMIWNALDESESNRQFATVPRESTKQQALRKDGQGKIDSLQTLVQARLWSSQKELGQ